MSPPEEEKTGQNDAPKKSKRARKSQRKTREVARPTEAAEPEEATEPKAAKPRGAAKKRAVDVPRDTLTNRVMEARRAGLVVLAFRAIGGGIATLAALSIVVTVFIFVFTLTVAGMAGPIFVLTTMGAVALVVSARFATRRSMPEAAAKLPFLENHAFAWADPFRDERPRFLPLWLEAVLWAPRQVSSGLEPFLELRKTGRADAEAAGDVARGMVENGEVMLDEGLPAGSAELRGLRLLLLLRLARLVVEDGKLLGRVSGLGHVALFEGTVG